MSMQHLSGDAHKNAQNTIYVRGSFKEREIANRNGI